MFRGRVRAKSVHVLAVAGEEAPFITQGDVINCIVLTINETNKLSFLLTLQTLLANIMNQTPTLWKTLFKFFT